jgi:hypothetical protein
MRDLATSRAIYLRGEKNVIGDDSWIKEQGEIGGYIPVILTDFKQTLDNSGELYTTQIEVETSRETRVI